MFKTMGSTFTKFVFGLAALTGLNVAGQTADIKGFWSMSGERAWSEQELDRAFDLFKLLKSEHGEQFSLVVVDLHKQGQPSPSGAKTAQILVKVYVTPPSQSISTALTNAGMVFIPEP